MQKVLANGRAFLLLAARANGHRSTPEANWNSCWQHEPQCRAGVAGNSGPQVSDRIPMPSEIGVAQQDQDPEPAGHQPAGVPVNPWARTAVTYPGFTWPGEKILLSFSVLACDSRYLLSASECCPVRFKEVYVAAPRFAG